MGYVGSTFAVLLSGQHDVFVLDINRERVEQINNRQSPIGDVLMENMLQDRSPRLTATMDPIEAFSGAEYIIIATNTNLDPEKGTLNTDSIEAVMELIDKYCSDNNQDSSDDSVEMTGVPTIVIRSTVPVGYTRNLKSRYSQFSFLNCPEFLREKTAMEDVMNPSRIVVGWDGDERDQERAVCFAGEVVKCTGDSELPVLFTNTSEAEAIKLFSNSYLAVRISFFNELDTFATERGLDSSCIIKGVCLDPRIGDWYNVPGPGFGGHCLPKDTQQLVSDFGELPETLIRAAIEANNLRKTVLENK